MHILLAFLAQFERMNEKRGEGGTRRCSADDMIVLQLLYDNGDFILADVT